MNKKLILLIAALLLLICGVLFSYYNFKKPVKITEIKDNPFSILIENASDTFAESTEWYDTKIMFPKNNQKVSDLIFARYEDYLKETEVKKYTDLAAAKEGLQINVEGLQYAFSADYKLYTSTGTISYVFQIYTFTGGAHGSTQLYAITQNEKQEIVSAEQILPTDKLQKISELAIKDLQKQKAERMKSYGTMTDKEIAEAIKNDDFIDDGTKPTRDNYSVAWYDKDDVVISFGQYQVGPYVEGMYEVRIPKSSI